ncbi:dipeptidase [Paraburkholderia unamae]|uniref:Membrane dipeptidase n=1 Tax=Paraburkholderia unamae TaxID=219649 RepID=A0ABX5KIU7_9BURK|nr:membrane dipeptidase [Paraburkholderia unamae]PVX81341.1 membrane dipeptidase [Paraburkholderia unamae]
MTMRTDDSSDPSQSAQPVWSAIRDDSANALHDTLVEIDGWMIPLDPASTSADYFLLAADEPCCGGCVPRNPFSCIEVVTRAPLVPERESVRLSGRLIRLIDDPAGWRYRLEDAQRVPQQPGSLASATGMSRRAFLASGAALGLAACAPGRFARYADTQDTQHASAASDSAPSAWQASTGALTIDMHSHAGHVIVSRNPALGERRALTPVSAPMRAGGMNVICLAIVTDTVVTRVSADRKRFEAWRTPQPGELYQLGQIEFARAKTLVEREQLDIVTNASMLASVGGQKPCVIIAAEGADFLEGQLERVDEAYSRHQLRHLQLTHYRVNELGDIQTEAPVHGGLTDFGADVVRRCNTLGIVVDVAHGTYDLVKRAAAVTTKPLVLSHTALASHPGARSRLITADHARAVAQTGGVIGVWPSSGTFHDLGAMAHGFRRMADVVGVDHVGLGSDMYGFISPPVFQRYEQLPALGAALRAAGFSQQETEQMLGGNYRRVFEATLA